METSKEDLKAALLAMRAQIEEAVRLVEEGKVEEAVKLVREIGMAVSHPDPRHVTAATAVPEGSRVIEGVFDGEHMVGSDGRKYLVPPNYVSKSKMVEGDMVKLSITPQGAFIYKQIGPIERKRVVGTLMQDENSFWHVSDGVHSWRVLTASVSFFKGKVGDEAVILVPSSAPSKWAAVENIIAK